MADGLMPPSVVGSGGIAPMYENRGNVGGRCIAPCVAGWEVCVEGPLPLCVTSSLAWLVTMGGGNWLMTACMSMLGPLAKLWVTCCGVDMGPLAMVM